MAESWSRAEVEATVADYFEMWAKELAHIPFNKAQHNRALQPLLNGRSGQAVEFKHANISAILLEFGLPYIEGYKPRSNYQDLLREVVEERLALDPSIEQAATVSVEADVVAPMSRPSWESTLVAAPAPDPKARQIYDRRVAGSTVLRGVNYLEREARNRSLGAAGEEFALGAEHSRLWTAGEKRLAERIEHVSASRGDGLGYDILSFETDGRERRIEVKTTRYGVMTPFFISGNELAVSRATEANFHLYRLFRFDEAPKLFVLRGPLEPRVNLDPVSYRASLR